MKLVLITLLLMTVASVSYADDHHNHHGYHGYHGHHGHHGNHSGNAFFFGVDLGPRYDAGYYQERRVRECYYDRYDRYVCRYRYYDD